MGAASACHGWPVSALRTNEKKRNAATYAALMCRRPTRHTITAPSVQMAIIGHRLLPHWMESTDTVAGARNTTVLTPKFDGFHRWRPSRRSTYFDTIEIRLASAYGHRKGDRTRIPTLSPVMYALAGWGHRRKV